MIAVGIFSVIVTLGLLAAPMVIRRPHYHDLTGAISNLRQIGLALYEFEVAYGQMPDDSTLAKVEAAYPGTGIPMGTKSSNDYFRQLIVSEIASNESMFYARFPGTKKPDNVITAGRALEKGECGFAYIMGAPTHTNPNRPLAVYPLVKGKLVFDTKICRKELKGKACILRADNSVTTITVDKKGRAILNGKDLFDPSQPFWGGKTPVVKWPE